MGRLASARALQVCGVGVMPALHSGRHSCCAAERHTHRSKHAAIVHLSARGVILPLCFVAVVRAVLQKGSRSSHCASRHMRRLRPCNSPKSANDSPVYKHTLWDRKEATVRQQRRVVGSTAGCSPELSQIDPAALLATTRAPAPCTPLPYHAPFRVYTYAKKILRACERGARREAAEARAHALAAIRRGVEREVARAALAKYHGNWNKERVTAVACTGSGWWRRSGVPDDTSRLHSDCHRAAARGHERPQHGLKSI